VSVIYQPQKEVERSKEEAGIEDNNGKIMGVYPSRALEDGSMGNQTNSE
jgi:hypothetical protein